jgi:predicted Zn-dependent peptidase
MKKFFLTIQVVLAIALVACNSSRKLDRSIVPVAGPAPKIQIGQYQMTTLPNGLKLVVVENHKLPRVSYNINLDIDPLFEGDRAGYAMLSGELMKAGTKSRTKAQIDEAVDFMGASLSTSSNGVFGGCLAKHTEDFLTLMADVVLNPTFPSEELEKSRKQQLSNFANEKTDPNSMSDKIGNVMKYGPTHPYGEFMTEASLKAITTDDLYNYYHDFFRPNVAYLVVVGDITFEKAQAQAIKYFGSWEQKKVRDLSYTTPLEPQGNVVAFVPLVGAVQSVIDITYPVDIRPGTQDAIVASVLNNILGGSGFQARLMQNLREDKAYTYGAYSSISPDEIIGSFSAGASVRNAVTDSAVTEILFEMDRLVKEPVADSTLQTIKNIMTGGFARSLERPQTIANFALNIEKYKLPKDFYETYLQKLNAVTVADVQAMAKRVLRPANAYITVVGNREEADKLAKFAASGKVNIVNADGTPFSDLKPAPEGVNIQTVIDAYASAMGGKEAFTLVKSYEQVGEMKVGPMALSVNMKVKDNAKLVNVISMNGSEMMKQVFDGNKGVNVQMGAKKPMDESEVIDIKMQIDMMVEANYDKYGAKAVLKGIGKVDDEDVYVVEVTKSSGDVSTDYYSVKTGLKVMSTSLQGEGEESILAETRYIEYATANVPDGKAMRSIKYPSKFKQSAGQQLMEFSFTELRINPKLNDKDFTVE